MSITRIGETQAKPELTEATSTGSMQRLRDFLESHRASVKNIPPEMFGEIRPLLASAPSGGYYELIHNK